MTVLIETVPESGKWESSLVRKHQIPITCGELTGLRRTGQQTRDQSLRRKRIGGYDAYLADSDDHTHKPTEYQ